MFKTIRDWRIRRIVARHPIADTLWQQALRRCGPARRLGASDQATLRVLATLFLERKSLEPVQDLRLDHADRVLLAAHACIPILKLGLDWYDGWYSVIVYPGAFMPRRNRADAAGVVHRTDTVLAGEAWGRGPVILSWPDVLEAGEKPGHNVVIHEMAHKLDMLNGDANGFPPLHRRMDRRIWWQTFSAAWDHAGTAPQRPSAADRRLCPHQSGRVLRRDQRAVLRKPGRTAPASAGGLPPARTVLPPASVLSHRAPALPT